MEHLYDHFKTIISISYTQIVLCLYRVLVFDNSVNLGDTVGN